MQSTEQVMHSKCHVTSLTNGKITAAGSILSHPLPVPNFFS